MTRILSNYSADSWRDASGGLADIRSALTGETVAQTGSEGLDFAGMLEHARTVGGPALRAMSFQRRAAMLKALGAAIIERKEELYALSAETGATRQDGWIDIEGGAGTLLALASRGRKELPDDVILTDGDFEPIGKRGTFAGQHVYTSLHGAAVQINAFNFPVWGMLEKLGPALLAGVPVIVKPATATAQVAEAAFRILIETGVLPAGAAQLIVGPVGDLIDHLGGQDLVSFTGSAETAARIHGHPVFAREGVRFVAERDSLNASILGPDAAPRTPEFDLFIAEVVREMTIKAGQKCTAIRRAMVPAAHLDAAEAALAAARRRLDTLGKQLGQADAQADSARAQREISELNIASANLTASITGRVGDMTVRAGQFVQPGQRLMSLVPRDQVYVTANFKETQLGLIRPGQPVRIEVDALPGLVLRGRVESIAPGTGAEFSILPPQNATGNFTKIVQRVPVRIALQSTAEVRRLLVPGMSVGVTIDTRNARGQLERLRRASS